MVSLAYGLHGAIAGHREALPVSNATFRPRLASSSQPAPPPKSRAPQRRSLRGRFVRTHMLRRWFLKLLLILSQAEASVGRPQNADNRGLV
jgi:hypothetical protein